MDGRAAEVLTGAIRGVHDFLTVAAPDPLQEAGATALAMPPSSTRARPRSIASGAT